MTRGIEKKFIFMIYKVVNNLFGEFKNLYINPNNAVYLCKMSLNIAKIVLSTEFILGEQLKPRAISPGEASSV